MSNPRYGSGRKQFVGQGIEADLSKLDPAAYTGAVAYSDGELYYSDGSEWVVPQDEVDISRPRNLAPTTSTEQAQLRLSAFRSPTGESQTGIIFEINTDGLPEFGEGSSLITRNVTSEVASLYNIAYPDDGFQPGETIWWRARYLGTNGTQSQYSIPTAQKFPDLITTPSPVTPSNAITGTVTLTPYESAPVFGLQYYQTQVEFYAAGATPGVDTPLATVTQTSGAVTTTPIPPLIAGQSYQWRGRYTGRVNSGSPTVTSGWSVARTIFLGAASIVLEYDMDLVTARTIYIPLGGSAPVGEPYSVTVDWGDGTSNVYTTGGVKTKVYAVGFTPTDGRFTVTITGRLNSFGGINATPNQTGLVRVNNIGFTMGLTSLQYMCQGTTVNLEYFTPNLPDTITSLEGLFYNCNANPPSLSDLDTRNVTNMNSMFFNNSIFNRPINGWNTSKVTNMSDMFRQAGSFNQNIGAWDVSKVTNMGNMFFLNYVFNNGGSPDINNWNTESVTIMSNMFYICIAFNQPVGGWNVSKVTNMNSMFYNCSIFNNGGSNNINNWVTTSLVNVGGMFWNCFVFNQPVGNWNMASVTGIPFMFTNALVFNQPIGNWNVSNVIDMNATFQLARAFNQNIGAWNTGNVIDMPNMFNEATVFNNGGSPDINNWNTSKVTRMQSMFSRCRDFDQPIGNWDVSKVTNFAYMFSGIFGPYTKFNQPLNTWNTASATTMNNMFREMEFFNQPISNFDMRNVTDAAEMFASVTPYNQDLGALRLRKAGVTLAGFGIRLTSEENYSRTLIGWANYVATTDGPYTVPLNVGATRLYNANNYVTGARFTNATAARAFLVGGRVVSVTGASDTNANTTYTYNGTTQTYDASNGWKFAILGSSWGLYDGSAVLQATGTGTASGSGPHTATSWTGVLSAATVLRTGASWTITGDAAA